MREIKKNTLILWLSALISCSAMAIHPAALSKQQPQVNYLQAFAEIKKMIEGAIPMSFKQAVFTVENAYMDNELDTAYYRKRIDFLSRLAPKISQTNGLNYSQNDKATVAKYAGTMFIMTRPTPIMNGIDTIYVPPFYLDTTDIDGKKEWTQTFVYKLLKTHTGNSRSMAYLFKIVMEQLGEQTYLTLTPNHTLIKIRNNGENWHYFDVTTGSLIRDSWFSSSDYIPLNAVINNTYLDTLSQQQSLSLLLLDLAKGYHKKMGVDDGIFILQCIQLALQYYPNYADAIAFKAEIQKERLNDRMNNNQATSPDSQELTAVINEINFKLQELGYKKMSKEAYLGLINGWVTAKNDYSNGDIIEATPVLSEYMSHRKELYPYSKSPY